jgi:hypothetical protein
VIPEPYQFENVQCGNCCCIEHFKQKYPKFPGVVGVLADKFEQTIMEAGGVENYIAEQKKAAKSRGAQPGKNLLAGLGAAVSSGSNRKTLTFFYPAKHCAKQHDTIHTSLAKGILKVFSNL